jgi:drug/metabolite transporter (DMT)-like permease
MNAQPALLALGAAVTAAGIAVAWIGRRRLKRAHAGGVTLVALGLCGAVIGYHAIALALPPERRPMSVPKDRWWVLGVALGVSVAASAVSEWIERRSRRHRADGEGGFHAEP